jgi:OOP family OmpA-OmpF porin
MSFNLIEAAKGLFTNELVSKLSTNLGESENGITKAIGGLLPSIIGGITEKAQTTEGASQVLNLATQANGSGLLDNLGSLFGSSDADTSSKSIVSSIFGEGKLASVVSLISNFSGIKSSSTSSLLSLAVPAVLGLIGKQVKTEGLNTNGLSSLLSSQKSNLLAAIPAGLGLGSLFDGFGDKTHGNVKKVVNHSTEYVEKTTKKAGNNRWLLPLLFMIAAAAILFYFLKGCNSDQTVSSGMDTTKNIVTTTLGKVDSLTGDFVYDLGEMVDVDLPNGTKINVGKNSTEFKLISFLNDKDAVLDSAKGNWFEFTNVRFKTGGSEITEESIAQLTNMVAISKAYPKAQFKVGGYTDNTGDKAKNVELSQKRADVVVSELKKLGVANEALVGSKGFGEEWPIATNDTVEGKAQNRRVAVNVKAK